ncbi:6-phosphogluconolactonase, partial [Passer montanus]|uniref:6-phosphogluconolactonase n=1 Tax=Passer montanus TaxID=9160 RepID=UPI001961797D
MAAVSVFPSQGELGAALARLVAEAAAEAVASGGRFTLGLSGGSLRHHGGRQFPVIFPRSQEQHSLVCPVLDSPKPPPQRVTMTLPLLNAAKSLLVVATGASKAPVLKVWAQIPGFWVKSKIYGVKSRIFGV